MIGRPGLAAIWDALPEARVVGGAVRDMLAGQEVADVDLASPLPPEVAMQRLREAGIKTVPTGLAHGTITAVSEGHGFEITTLRRDVATDGRRAVVAFTDDWETDASRRDFTLNAMSADRHGRVYDYFNGRDDLAAGRIRFVGAARLRIEEDYLRILRFFRFLARFGKGAPDGDAVAAIADLSGGVLTLSAERVWMEIKLLLAAPDPRRAVALMQEVGVLPLLLPRADVGALGRMVEAGAPVDALLRLAALLAVFADDVADLAARFRLSGEERARLLELLAPNRLRPDAADSDLRRALAEDEAAMLVARTWLAEDGSTGWQGLRDRVGAMRRPVFPLAGRDVLAMGVPPGPLVGQVLEAVRRWWMMGGCTADAAACRGRASMVLSEIPR